MGSSEDTRNKGIEVSVGSLVWVRRRNGSWWPGQILDPEELPAKCLISPKSGAPVKLLGKENASVDWYNLEKSARVKSFRCGEYDECIEKAKAAVTKSSWKTVKYARREGAIIHALELESALLCNGHQDTCSEMDLKEHDSRKEEAPSLVHSHDGFEEMADASTSNHESDLVGLEVSQSCGVSFEDPNHLSSLKEQFAHGTRCRTPTDSEDDGTERVKRMRGLDDLGMIVASSFKRKISRVAHAQESLKKKKRRRALSKVLENTMVTVPIMCDEFAVPNGSYLPGTYDSKVSELEYDEKRSLSINNSDCTVVSCENGTLVNGSEVENQASDTVECCENGSSDKLFDVPLVAEEDHLAVSPVSPCASQQPQFIAGAQSCQSSRLEERNEPVYITAEAPETNCINQRKTEKGATEWQLKGKRNLRNAGKSKRQEDRSMDTDEEYDGYLVGEYCSNKKRESPFAGCLDGDGSPSVKSKPISEIQSNEFKGWRMSHHKEPHTKGETQRLLPYRQSRFSVNPKYDPLDFPVHHHLADNLLYDVNVQVQSAGCRPHHVPYISLMSKLNGRPIVGHPLTVEVLKDGFCDDILGSSVLYRQTLQSPKSRRNGALQSPKKIRKLSSLNCSIRQMDEEDECPKARIEKLKGPAVACIPLNIVFSRLNAAFSGSIRHAIRRLMPDNS